MGNPEYQFCQSSVFLPTSLNAFWLSVGAGLLPNLFLLAINTHKREREYPVEAFEVFCVICEAYPCEESLLMEASPAHLP
jgi:hypothetical protein